VPVITAGGPFLALHMSLIPKGPHQGHVLVWNHHHYTTTNSAKDRRVITYAIVDPYNKSFWNFYGPVHPGSTTPTCFLKGEGDLFCAGHAWNHNGDLFIAGGTKCHPPGGTNCSATNPCECSDFFTGSKLAYIWTPPTVRGGSGVWHKQPGGSPTATGLQKFRWYPAVVALGPSPTTGNPNPDKDIMLVMGGSHGAVLENSYEAWIPDASPSPNGKFQESSPGTRLVVAGPATASYPGYELAAYPRAHYLSNRKVFVAGHGGSLSQLPSGSAAVEHNVANPGFGTVPSWLIQPPTGGRYYNSTVLAPISPGGVYKDYVISIGGMDFPTKTMLSQAFNICHATGVPGSTGAWGLLPVPTFPPPPGGAYSPTPKRWCHNTVLLPDSTIFIVGGQTTPNEPGCALVPALVPELYCPSLQIWQGMAPMTIIRDYHSTALLLAGGHVFTAGGESRRRYPATGWSLSGGCQQGTAIPGPSDYQIFDPHYLTCLDPRPEITNAPLHGQVLTFQYGGNYAIRYKASTLPQGYINKVVLMRAGSITHHNDGNQRCVELNFSSFAGTDSPPTDPGVNITIPALTDHLLPRGYYMLFLVTDKRAPSTVPATATEPQRGCWVKVQ
jgi:Galactose oxidase-like, Early set domain